MVKDTVTSLNERKKKQKKAKKNRPHSENPVIEEQLPPPPPMYNQEVELSEIEFSDEQMVIDITNNDNEPQTSVPVVSSSSIQSTTSQPSRNSHKIYTDDELEILNELIQHKGRLPIQVKRSIANRLGWDESQVWSYWYNASGERKARKLQKQEANGC